MSRRMTRTLLACVAAGALLVVGVRAAPADAMPLDQVVATIRDAGGHYQARAATLRAADCSGLVSVAQSLAMGEPVRRLGNTHTLLAGQWPHVVRGANPGDRFIIATNRRHMVAEIDGIGIEARQTGEKFRVGPAACGMTGSRPVSTLMRRYWRDLLPGSSSWCVHSGTGAPRLRPTGGASGCA